MEGSQEVCRTEKKYPVSRKTAGQIEARLSYLLPLDEHCKNGKPYLVRSLYFDSRYDQGGASKEDPAPHLWSRWRHKAGMETETGKGSEKDKPGSFKGRSGALDPRGLWIFEGKTG